jgi:hypothetical protein
VTAPGAPRAGWRAWPVLVLALLWSWLPIGQAWGQAVAPALAHLVQPKPGTRPLGVILAELSRQGQLPFSYSSSLVPVAYPCTLRPGPARPLGAVLREVLAAEHLSYGLLNGQLVLWPDRVAAPLDVTAVNGRLTPVAQPDSPRLAAASPTASEIASSVTGSTKPATINPHPVDQPIPLRGKGLPRPATHSQRNKAATAIANSPTATAKSPLARPHAGLTAPIFISRRGAEPTKRSKSETRHSGIAGPAKQATAQVPGEIPVAPLPPSGRRRGRPLSLDLKASKAASAARLPHPVRNARLPQPRVGQLRNSLTLLPARLVSPTQVFEAGETALPGQVPASLGLIPLAHSADSGAHKPPVRAGLLQRSYLHGEAWVSESLPLSAAVKLGIPHIYLVLGVAAGPFDHELGVAWGVGLGTAGRPRGRFTPSLDLMLWRLGSDRRSPASQLTQLRPLVAWQLKQGGRWQLVGGPTLNLSTEHHDGPSPNPGPRLGQGQWHWLDADDGRSSSRLWPGVQVGLRF